MSDSPARPRSAGRVLAIVGASGGCGASTLVAAVGARLAHERRRSCVVVDLQRGGGGLDVPYALEHVGGVRWGDLAAVEGPVDGAAVLARLPDACGVRVLSHDREPGPVPEPASCLAVLDGLRARVDAVVLDVPRNVGDELLGRVDAAVVVAATGVLELSSLAAVGRRVGSQVDETFLVLRGRRESSAIAGEVTRALDLPVLGWLRDDARVQRNLARGRGPVGDGPLAQLARQVVSVVFADAEAVAS